MVNTRYKISEKKASSFGGLHAISELLYKIGFKRLFDDVFGNIRKVRSYKPVENLQVLISSILCGGERLADVDRLRTDSVLPALFSTGVVPYDTTIRRDLQYIGDYSESRQEFLFRINEVLLNNTKPESMTIDVDGTATKVEGHQENACKGYCPESPGDRCFQHLIISWDDMDTVLSIDTRGGEVHCIDGADDQMKDVLDRFSSQVDNILVRCDAGFYSDSILDLLESYDNVEYEVMGAKLDAVVVQIGDHRFKSYHGSDREYATFHHKIGKGKLRTYYVERYHKDEKMYLFDGMQWDYRVIVSNRSGKQPHTLFREYNLRARQ
ncbi:transposase [bacterium]|nr:transposase [bacterium]